MDTSIGDYFHHLAKVGAETQVTDVSGEALSLDAALGHVVELVLAAKARLSRIMFIGNGGSAGIASHMATDWLKNGGFAATCFNDGATLTCLGNDLGYDQVFAAQVGAHARAGDVLFAISSSGSSPNILNAVAAAGRREATVVTLSGFKPDNPLRRLGAVNFWIPDGHYGFVEIGHLALCHAVLDMAMGWRQAGDLPVYAATGRP